MLVYADLITLFLSQGADPNFILREVQGPALLKAVRRTMNLPLVEILALRTDRVNFTRALGLAVELQDSAMMRMLLANGVCCDFKEPVRLIPYITMSARLERRPGSK
ncbi:hypothetical protein MGN70_014740 [Eutypa lata]|nr:hypothetical protein MGN70_014740 [Eutypa lata]